MKSQFVLGAIAAVSLIPSIVVADDGFFVTGAVGSADLNEDFDGLRVDTDSTAFRFTVGWRFNEYVAVEAGYHNFGRFSETINAGGTSVRISVRGDGFMFGGIGSLPVTESLALFARAGAFFWDADADINNVTAARPEDSNLYFGAGARLALTERFALMVDGSRYDLDGASSTVFSVGFDLGF